MVKVIRKQRKPPVLTSSSIPCLRRLPTINVTQGCALGCTYCYIQAYSNYPGSSRVVLFENTAEIVREELLRKRRPPRRVYFSPSSDAFQYLPEIQEVTFRTISVLLKASVEVAFLTKGFITGRFLKMFSAQPHRVHAQVGITTLDRQLWKTFEPRTAPPARRLEYIRRLREIGVETAARLDPLIPDVTDTAENLDPLLLNLSKAGVASAAASFLFMRPAFAKRLSAQLAQLATPYLDAAGWEYYRFVDGCGGGRTISPAERAARFARLAAMGERYNIRIAPCRCKNPELEGEGCQIAGSISSLTRGGAGQQLFSWQPVPRGIPR